MLKAYALLRHYRAPLVADFHREYGIDLEARIAEGTIRPSQVEKLASNLSRDAALWAHIDPEMAAWGLQEHLLAEVVDNLRTIRWMMAGSKGPRPEFVPRPGAEETEDQNTITPTTAFDSIKDFDDWYAGTRADYER